MKSITVAALAVGAAGLLQSREHYEAKFIDWMREHNIKLKNGEEFVHRLSVFASMDDFITEHNAMGSSFTVGHNAFSMYTNQEFQEMMGLNRPAPERPVADSIHDSTNVAAVPASVDWVSAGAVTPVKNQGQCGSCWSFSTTGALEGIYEIRNNKLVSFSEQQLVSCDTDGKYANYGCNGGSMDYAFEWINQNGGLCKEDDYPYTSGASGTVPACQTSCTEVGGSKVSGYTDVTSNSESALQSATAQQPVSVGINANSNAFQLYSSGVFTGPCKGQVDHGVLVVGYGHDDASGLDYWKVKNSWGATWGEDGYILIQRNSGLTQGMCKILSSPSYPSL